jgi:hypothetical protein
MLRTGQSEMVQGKHHACTEHAATCGMQISQSLATVAGPWLSASQLTTKHLWVVAL